MGMLGAFIVGYVLGTKAGHDGVKELRQAWADISASEEFQALLATGVSVVSASVTQIAGQARANGNADRAPDPGIVSLALFRQIRERLA